MKTLINYFFLAIVFLHDSDLVFAQDQSPDLKRYDIESNIANDVLISQKAEVYKLQGDLLVYLTTIPKATGVRYPKNNELAYYDYKNANGEIQRNSSGFNSSLFIFQIPESQKKYWSEEQLKKINSTDGGLFISSVILSDTLVREPIIPIKDIAPQSGYLQFYNTIGKPKFNFTKAINKRFGTQLNRVFGADDLTIEQKEKSQKIINELFNFANRTATVDSKFLFIDQELANHYSIEYEKSGLISLFGAFSIAVKATAVRHGFSNVPCAEFMSEVLRQSYTRAGYNIFEDFNEKNNNKLIWSETAAVVGLSQALYLAGWIPWDASLYEAPIGALMMHGSGTSPGHTYISAGSQGSWIVDNGSPRGLNLKGASNKIIQNQYQTGVFFLPPGIVPLKWER